MSAPKFDVCQWNYQHPQASGQLHIPVMVLCNTDAAEIEANVRANTALDLPWVEAREAHSLTAIMVGGGWSVHDHLDDIRRLIDRGGVVFAINAASKFLRSHDIDVDYQVTCDAKAETASLIDDMAHTQLVASHVNPATIAAATQPVLWHSALHVNEDWFPADKRKRGGYALLGGEASSGLGALCVAFAMGYRRFEIFGYDSCHKGTESHAYRQKMNDSIPAIEFEWAGRKFLTSVTMRTQAERFPITAQALQQEGATLNVWGDGLLQHIWRTPAELLSEQDKYRKIWQIDAYRKYSPAETLVPRIAAAGMPHKPGPIIDFGCGTGRAGVALSRLGFEVVLVDFVSFARDHEAMGLQFLEWDLSRPCPLRAPFGYCCDVLEHIPPNHVADVIRNIMNSAANVFFQISTVPDAFGATINQTLHLTVHSPGWWVDKFESLGVRISNVETTASSVNFLATKD